MVRVALASLLLALTACPPTDGVRPCVSNDNCSLTAGGVCLASPLGEDHCAYPDPACPSGLAWGELSAGIAGQCVAGPDAGVDTPDAPLPDAGIDSPPVSGWAHLFNSTMDDTATAVLTASDGSVYVAGYFQGAATLAGEVVTSNGQADVFVAKFASTGERLWVRRFGGAGSDISYEMSERPGASGVVVVGKFVGTVDYGMGPVVGSSVAEGAAIALNTDGTTAFVARCCGAGAILFEDVAVGSDGSIFVLGRFNGSVVVGGNTYASAGDYDLVVAKYSSTGTLVWSRAIGGTGFDRPGGLEALGGGDVVLTATFADTISAGGGPLTSAGADDALLARLNGTTGEHVWSRRYGGAGLDNANGLLATSEGLLLVGDYSGTASFGAAPHTSAGNADAFVALVASDGTTLWSRSVGGAAADRAFAAAATGGAYWVVGNYNTALTIGSASFTSRGMTDIWIAQLANADGAVLSARDSGGPSYDVPYGIGMNGPYFNLAGFTGGNINLFGHQLNGDVRDGFLVQSLR